jgi:Circularly permutated YpsA SLOG family
VKGASAARTRAAAERQLRPALRPQAGLTVLTGGQTGIDTYAALAALRAGLPVHLVFPAGLRQEDGPIPPARRLELAGAVLHELTSASFRYRTWTCVYLADVVVLLDPAGGTGCRETARAARKLGRPLLSPRAGELTDAEVAGWLAETGARVLMVGGCRGSLLARKGKDNDAQADLTVLMNAATARHEHLLGHA